MIRAMIHSRPSTLRRNYQRGFPQNRRRRRPGPPLSAFLGFRRVLAAQPGEKLPITIVSGSKLLTWMQVSNQINKLIRSSQIKADDPRLSKRNLKKEFGITNNEVDEIYEQLKSHGIGISVEARDSGEVPAPGAEGSGREGEPQGPEPVIEEAPPEPVELAEVSTAPAETEISSSRKRVVDLADIFTLSINFWEKADPQLSDEEVLEGLKEMALRKGTPLPWKSRE